MFPAGGKCEVLRSPATDFLRQSLHHFLNLALATIHDGFKVSRFENDTSSDQDNVVAASQERDAVCDEDPSFGCEQTAGSDDMICEGFII